MKKCSHYNSPIGVIRIEECDGFLEAVTFVEGSSDDFANYSANSMYESSSPILEETARWLDAYFSGKPLKTIPPYKLVGTEFQKRVWEALLNIPYGSTASYIDISKMIDPNASAMMSRAVGNAIGANPLAILIPCHRVIKADGKIGNYRWGTEKKEWLLGHEAQKCKSMNMNEKYPIEEYLKLCKYYHGEETYPEEWENTVKAKFWHGERMFVRGRLDIKEWTNRAIDLKVKLTGEKLESANKYSDAQFGLILYINELFAKWCPYDDLDWIFEY